MRGKKSNKTVGGKKLKSTKKERLRSDKLRKKQNYKKKKLSHPLEKYWTKL